VPDRHDSLQVVGLLGQRLQLGLVLVHDLQPAPTRRCP
jgi:hypothetical protein